MFFRFLWDILIALMFLFLELHFLNKHSVTFRRISFFICCDSSSLFLFFSSLSLSTFFLSYSPFLTIFFFWILAGLLCKVLQVWETELLEGRFFLISISFLILSNSSLLTYLANNGLAELSHFYLGSHLLRVFSFDPLVTSK